MASVVVDQKQTAAVPLLAADRQQQPDKVLPWILTLSVAFGALLFGYHAGYSSPTDKAILEQVFAGNRAGLDFAWSVLNIGAMLGALVCGSAAGSLGRRPAILLGSIPYVLGALLMIFSSAAAPAMFTLGRFLAGAGVGYSSVIVPLYIAEIAPPSLRGTLGCVNQLNISAGVLTVSVLGIAMVAHSWWWRPMLFASLVFVLAQFVPIFVLAPESPAWLCSRGQMDQARASLVKLRGKNYQVDGELQSMALRSSQNASDSGETGWIAIMLTPRLRRPVLVGIGLMVLQQFSGINGVVFNMSSLFDSGSTDNRAQYVAMFGTCFVNGIQVLSTAVAVSLTEKFGRRQLLQTSCVGMALSCTLMAFASFFDMSTYVKIFALCGYICMFSIGVGPLAWLLCSEIFPGEIRSLAMSFATVLNWACAFAVTLTFEQTTEALGQHGLFLLYATCCILGSAFVFIWVPETRGLSLQEIEDMW